MAFDILENSITLKYDRPRGIVYTFILMYQVWNLYLASRFHSIERFSLENFFY